MKSYLVEIETPSGVVRRMKYADGLAELAIELRNMELPCAGIREVSAAEAQALQRGGVEWCGFLALVRNIELAKLDLRHLIKEARAEGVAQVSGPVAVNSEGKACLTAEGLTERCGVRPEGDGGVLAARDRLSDLLEDPDADNEAIRDAAVFLLCCLNSSEGKLWGSNALGNSGL